VLTVLRWTGAYDVGVFALFLFEVVFMDTAATIPTGHGRTVEILAFCIYGLFIGTIITRSLATGLGGGWLRSSARTLA